MMNDQVTVQYMVELYEDYVWEDFAGPYDSRKEAEEYFQQLKDCSVPGRFRLKRIEVELLDVIGWVSWGNLIEFLYARSYSRKSN